MQAVTYVTSLNAVAHDRIYDDLNAAGVPIAYFDGGIELYPGVPAQGMDSYLPHLEACCSRDVEPVTIILGVEMHEPGQLEIEVAVQYGSGPCCLNRGDINHDGSIPDISDLVSLVDYMFGGQPFEGCVELDGSMPETDSNNDGIAPDISDLVALVEYMFGGCASCVVPCP
jgi:hypothetical protein